jgi:hypothetical protein
MHQMLSLTFSFHSRGKSADWQKPASGGSVGVLVWNEERRASSDGNLRGLRPIASGRCFIMSKTARIAMPDIALDVLRADPRERVVRSLDIAGTGWRLERDGRELLPWVAELLCRGGPWAKRYGGCLTPVVKAHASDQAHGQAYVWCPADISLH